MTEDTGQWDSITVFLLDDHEVVRRGMRDLLAAVPDIEVVGEAGTAESALARMLVVRPDVAVLDAERMFLAEKTAKNYSSVLAKLGLRNE